MYATPTWLSSGSKTQWFCNVFTCSFGCHQSSDSHLESSKLTGSLMIIIASI